MRFLIKTEEVEAEALKILAKKMGYGSRQALVEEILRKTLAQFPDVLEEAAFPTAVKVETKELEAPWKPELRELTQDEVKDIFGEDA